MLAAGRPEQPMLDRLQPSPAGVPDLRRPCGCRDRAGRRRAWPGYPARAGPATERAACRPVCIAGFGVARADHAGVWYLFDLNVAKPIEALAGALARPRPCRRGPATMDRPSARYLGDLAPAADGRRANACGNPQRAGRGRRARDGLRLASEKARLEALLVGCAGGRAPVLGGSSARLLQRARRRRVDAAGALGRP